MIFKVTEEKHLVEHVKYVADIGYGYTKSISFTVLKG